MYEAVMLLKRKRNTMLSSRKLRILRLHCAPELGFRLSEK